MSATELAELLRAFAALLWPLVVLIALIAFRGDVQQFIARLRRGKVLGLEVELDQLERTATDAALEAATAQPALPPSRPPDPTTPRPPGSAVWPDWDEIHPSNLGRYVGSSDPKLALVALSAEIERTLRRILAGSQLPENWARRPLPYLIERIELPVSVREAVRLFYDVRSRIVHGHDVDDDDAVRALDSGLKILSALRSLPYETHVVRYPAVEVYSDSEATTLRPIRAVILQSAHPQRGTQYQIFPTRETYETGQAVTWDWNFDTVWDESWYRDPETAEIKKAWDSAAEFAGRPIEDVV